MHTQNKPEIRAIANQGGDDQDSMSIDYNYEFPDSSKVTYSRHLIGVGMLKEEYYFVFSDDSIGPNLPKMKNPDSQFKEQRLGPNDVITLVQVQSIDTDDEWDGLLTGIRVYN